MKNKIKVNEVVQLMNNYCKNKMDSARVREDVFFVYYFHSLIIKIFKDINEEENLIYYISKSPFPNRIIFDELLKKLRKDYITRVESHDFLEKKELCELGLLIQYTDEEFYPIKPLYAENERLAKFTSYFNQFSYLEDSLFSNDLKEPEGEDYNIQLQFLTWLKGFSKEVLFNANVDDKQDLDIFLNLIILKINEVENILINLESSKNKIADLDESRNDRKIPDFVSIDASIKNCLDDIYKPKKHNKKEFEKLEKILRDYFRGKNVGKVKVNIGKECKIIGKLARGLYIIHGETFNNSEKNIKKLMKFMIDHIKMYEDQDISSKSYDNTNLYKYMTKKDF